MLVSSKTKSYLNTIQNYLTIYLTLLAFKCLNSNICLLYLDYKFSHSFCFLGIIFVIIFSSNS